MKWHARASPRRSGRVPLLIERFVDRSAEFIYVPSDMVMSEAAKRGATPYDVKGVELGHDGAECSFDAIVAKYDLERDPALAHMARVIRGADTDDKDLTPESRGVEALLDGMRARHYPDDQAQRTASIPIFDALYGFCGAKAGRDRSA